MKLVLFPDQRKKVGLGTLQAFAAMQLIVICTYISCVDCAKRERIHEAYMHQWVVDNMSVTRCYTIMEREKPFWLHAAYSSRTTMYF